MSKITYVYRDGRWVEKSKATPLLSHYVIQDSHDPFQSMADGKMYDSKSAYRRSLKAQGLAELGNERLKNQPTPLPPLEPVIHESFEKVRQGYKPKPPESIDDWS